MKALHDFMLTDALVVHAWALATRWEVRMKRRASFSELHARSAFSFLHGSSQPELPLYDDLLKAPAASDWSPPPMSIGERLSADFATQGASTGPHPMKLWREGSSLKLQRAKDLKIFPSGMPIRIGGMVICRQRPGTAKGHCFISLEDETGIANLFVHQKTFHRLRLVISTEPFLLAEGRIQITEGEQATVYVTEVYPLPGVDPEHVARSHDFH